MDMQKYTEVKKVGELTIQDLPPRFAKAYAKARGPGLETGCGFFDVYACFDKGTFVGFHLDFTGT
jgi:hypothetical protein